MQKPSDCVICTVQLYVWLQLVKQSALTWSVFSVFELFLTFVKVASNGIITSTKLQDTRTNVFSAFYKYTVHRQQNVHYGTVCKVCQVLSSKAQISLSHSDSVMFCRSHSTTLTLSISVELHSLLTCHSVCPGLLRDFFNNPYLSVLPSTSILLHN